MPARPVDVSVVIVSYNAIDWLRRCLDAVTSVPTELNLEVVVVDNQSGPEVREYLAGRPHGVTTLQLEQNVGFGRACNFGIERTTGTYVLLLNPDAIIQPGALEALIGLYEQDPGRGLVGGRTLRPDGSLDPGSCWGRPTLWSYFCSAVGLTAVFRRSSFFDPESLGSWPRDSVREVDIVSGCLLLTSRTVWSQLGGFDPLFFMYGEDADLSIRAHLAGFRPAITPAATVIHALSATTGTPLAKQRLLLRGKVTLIRKHWPAARARSGIAVLIGGIAIRAGAEWLRRTEDTTMRTLLRERRDWSRGWLADPVLPRLAAGVPVPGAGDTAATPPPGEATGTERHR